jgi:hypothetical protein
MIYQGTLERDEAGHLRFKTAHMSEKEGASIGGSITVGTGKDALTFTGKVESWTNASTGQQEFSMRGGTMTQGDGEVTPVGFANFVGGQLSYAEGHTGITNHTVDPEGRMRIQQGDPNKDLNTFTEVERGPIAFPFKGPDGQVHLGLVPNATRTTEGITKKDGNGNWIDHAAKSSAGWTDVSGHHTYAGIDEMVKVKHLEQYGSVGGNWDGIGSSGSLGRVHRIDPGEDPEKMVHLLRPMDGSSSFELKSNKSMKEGDKAASTTATYDPVTLAESHHNKQSGYSENFSRVRQEPMSFKVDGVEYWGQGLAHYRQNEQGGQELVARTLTNEDKTEGIRLRQLENGEWTPSHYVRQGAAGNGWSITSEDTSGHDVHPISVVLPGGAKATVMAEQSLAYDALDQSLNPEAKGRLIAEKVMGSSTGEAVGMVDNPMGGKDFARFTFSRDPNDPSKMISHTQAINTAHVEGPDQTAWRVESSQKGQPITMMGTAGNDLQIYDRVNWKVNSGADLTWTQMAFVAKGTDRKNPTVADTGIAFGLETMRLGTNLAGQVLGGAKLIGMTGAAKGPGPGINGSAGGGAGTINRGGGGPFPGAGSGSAGGRSASPLVGPSLGVSNGGSSGGGLSGEQFQRQYGVELGVALSAGRSAYQELELTGKTQQMSSSEVISHLSGVMYDTFKKELSSKHGDEVGNHLPAHRAVHQSLAGGEEPTIFVGVPPRATNSSNETTTEGKGAPSANPTDQHSSLKPS